MQIPASPTLVSFRRHGRLSPIPRQDIMLVAESKNSAKSSNKDIRSTFRQRAGTQQNQTRTNKNPNCTVGVKMSNARNQWLVDESVTSSAAQSPQVAIPVGYDLLDKHANRRIMLKQMPPIIMRYGACLRLESVWYFQCLSDEQVYIRHYLPILYSFSSPPNPSISPGGDRNMSSPCTDLPFRVGFSFSWTNFFVSSISHALQSPSFSTATPSPRSAYSFCFLYLVSVTRSACRKSIWSYLNVRSCKPLAARVRKTRLCPYTTMASVHSPPSSPSSNGAPSGLHAGGWIEERPCDSRDDND